MLMLGAKGITQTRQLHYEMGYKVAWGGNDIGDPDADQVLVLGTRSTVAAVAYQFPTSMYWSCSGAGLVSYWLATPDDVATLDESDDQSLGHDALAQKRDQPASGG